MHSMYIEINIAFLFCSLEYLRIFNKIQGLFKEKPTGYYFGSQGLFKACANHGKPVRLEENLSLPLNIS